MTADIGAQFLVPAVGVLSSAVTIFGAFHAFLRDRKASLRDDYRFVREFLADLNAGSNHAVTLEYGYQAIAGNPDITSEEVAFLLTFPQPGKSVRNYVASRRAEQPLID